MASSPAPHAHMVRVRELTTGRVFEAWPVDAREMVAHTAGGYEYAPEAPLGLPDAPVVEARPPATIQERLAEKSRKELQLLAKRAGLNERQKDDELIAALIPHIEGGTVSLDEIPPIALPSVQFPGATVAD